MASSSRKRKAAPAEVRVLFGSTGWTLLQQKIRKALPEYAHLVILDDSRPLKDQVSDADVIIPTVARVDEEVLAAAPRLRLVVQPAAGYSNIDVPAAKARGVPVCIAPGVNAQSTAECAVMLMLMLAKKVDEARRNFEANVLGEPVGLELRGKVLGVVGMGAVGKIVARVCEALGMSVLATTSASSRQDLEHLLASSDVVSLHCPLLPATQGLIGKTEMALMKPSALLVNMARGPVVCREALADAVFGGRLAGVALDVHWSEPGWDASEKLYKHERVIATPHVGSTTNDVFEVFARYISDNVSAVFDERERDLSGRIG